MEAIFALQFINSGQNYLKWCRSVSYYNDPRETDMYVYFKNIIMEYNCAVHYSGKARSG